MFCVEHRRTTNEMGIAIASTKCGPCLQNWTHLQEWEERMCVVAPAVAFELDVANQENTREQTKHNKKAPADTCWKNIGFVPLPTKFQAIPENNPLISSSPMSYLQIHLRKTRAGYCFTCFYMRIERCCFTCKKYAPQHARGETPGLFHTTHIVKHTYV